MKFSPWPYFEHDEINAAVEVLRSGKVNQWTGNQVNKFEEEFSNYLGVNHSIALANGSLALDLALRAYDIGPGDEVIVTPRSFVASANCVVLRGAVPVFVDVDPISQNITIKNIEEAVTEKTRAVIAVNLSGWPCELDTIKHFCKSNNIYLIEDCAQAHGSAYKNQKTGTFGDCAIFSFCQDKIMTTGGEGGMFVTNHEGLRDKIWSFKDHGKNLKTSLALNHPPGFRWLIDNAGTNCRMTEMQAAIGRVMLKKLDNWVDIRRSYAAYLNESLGNVQGLRCTVPDDSTYHSYYKYYVFIKSDELKNSWNRDEIIEYMQNKGVPCNTGICPEIYRENVFKKYNYKLICSKANDNDPFLPVARELGETSIMLLVHPTLDFKSIEYTAEQLQRVMKVACK